MRTISIPTPTKVEINRKTRVITAIMSEGENISFQLERVPKNLRDCADTFVAAIFGASNQHHVNNFMYAFGYNGHVINN